MLDGYRGRGSSSEKTAPKGGTGVKRKPDAGSNSAASTTPDREGEPVRLLCVPGARKIRRMGSGSGRGGDDHG